jgi:hypothetical protein
MEKVEINEDIKLMCVPAKSFPDGIMEAFQTLGSLHPSMKERAMYGISHADKNGEIIYKAATPESFKGETEEFGCEMYIVRKGEYMSETIHDYMSKLPEIGETFHKLLQHPQLDRNGACVEWYKSRNEVLCMVRLEN